MKAFQFRLQAVLQLKEQIESKQLLLYAEALNQHQKEKIIYDKHLSDLLEAQDHLGQKLKGSVLSVMDIQRDTDTIHYLREALEHQKMRVDFAQKTVEEAHYLFIECKKKREILEKLKKNQKMIYVQGLFRREEREIEDIIQSRYRFL
jgi:flagellar FliJ protein